MMQHACFSGVAGIVKTHIGGGQNAAVCLPPDDSPFSKMPSVMQQLNDKGDTGPNAHGMPVEAFASERRHRASAVGLMRETDGGGGDAGCGSSSGMVSRCLPRLELSRLSHGRVTAWSLPTLLGMQRR
jgi:hypothetical protein